MLRIGAIDQRETRRQELEMLLIERVLSGDVEAFYELVKPYEHMIYRSAALILHNETDAEDATQEAMYRAFANLARFRRECRFSTWIVRIAINEALMQLRRSRRIPYVGSLTHAGEDYNALSYKNADHRETPCEALLKRELHSAVRKAVDSLPPSYRDVLFQRDLCNRSIRQTALSLGINEGLVKTRLFRARFKVKRVLASLRVNKQGLLFLFEAGPIQQYPSREVSQKECGSARTSAASRCIRGNTVPSL